MSVEIRDYIQYREAEILSLYEAVGWQSYTTSPQRVRDSFAHSLLTLGAYEEGRLVAFLRAVGDGASILYLQDIVVSPALQRRGIGSALVREVLHRFPRVYQVVLLTDQTEKTRGFYQACGFMQAEEAGCRSFLRIVDPVC